jgi:hypothetical protein
MKLGTVRPSATRAREGRNRSEIRMFQGSKQSKVGLIRFEEGLGHLDFRHSVLFRISSFEFECWPAEPLRRPPPREPSSSSPPCRVVADSAFELWRVLPQSGLASLPLFTCFLPSHKPSETFHLFDVVGTILGGSLQGLLGGLEGLFVPAVYMVGLGQGVQDVRLR